jgi:uncharacterized membrane protein YphA (DoxX/SURF4 family)
MRTWAPWAGVLARLVVGGVWLVAGVLKLPDPAENVRTVRAYQILPESVVPAVGHGLPILEILVGACLLLGLLTRVAGGLSALMQLAFVIGIASVWARGLSIDCGCFGGGGNTVLDPVPGYIEDLLRDGLLLALAAALAVWPASRLSLDGLLRLTPTND